MSYIFGRNKGWRRSSSCIRQTALYPIPTNKKDKADNSPIRFQHLVVKMPDDALYSARGVRFKETIVTRSIPNRIYEGRWPTPSTSTTIISGPLVTFSFLLSEKVEKISYKQQQQELKKEFERLCLCKEGLLFNTREKGVLFPVVHLSYTSQLTKTDDNTLPPGLFLHQGIYQEVRNITPDTELPQVCPAQHDQSAVGYILLGFKSLDRNFSQVMVDTWKDWTGARYIYMYLPDDLGLRRITFYHRQKPDDLNFFMYLVVVECHGITSKEKQLRLLDFAQRMRLERMSGYISVYSAEEKGITSPGSSLVSERVKRPEEEPSSAERKSHILDVFLTNTLLPRNTRV